MRRWLRWRLTGVYENLVLARGDHKARALGQQVQAKSIASCQTRQTISGVLCPYRAPIGGIVCLPIPSSVAFDRRKSDPRLDHTRSTTTPSRTAATEQYCCQITSHVCQCLPHRPETRSITLPPPQVSSRPPTTPPHPAPCAGISSQHTFRDDPRLVPLSSLRPNSTVQMRDILPVMIDNSMGRHHPQQRSRVYAHTNARPQLPHYRPLHRGPRHSTTSPPVPRLSLLHSHHFLNSRTLHQTTSVSL